MILTNKTCVFLALKLFIIKKLCLRKFPSLAFSFTKRPLLIQSLRWSQDDGGAVSDGDELEREEGEAAGRVSDVFAREAAEASFF